MRLENTCGTVGCAHACTWYPYILDVPNTSTSKVCRKRARALAVVGQMNGAALQADAMASVNVGQPCEAKRGGSVLYNSCC